MWVIAGDKRVVEAIFGGLSLSTEPCKEAGSWPQSTPVFGRFLVSKKGAFPLSRGFLLSTQKISAR